MSFYRVPIPEPSDFDTDEEYEQAMVAWEYAEQDYEDAYIEQCRMENEY